MIDFLFSAQFLVYIALAFQSLGLIARDELWLRILILMGSGFYLAYYFFIGENPLWEAMFASGVLAVINLIMIVVLVFERTTFAMSDEMTRIYRSFPTLNPGQFRKVMKIGKMSSGSPGTVLVTDGKPLHKLFLVTDGKVNISKGGKQYQAAANVFIGEVSFLREGPASATVTVSEAANYMQWSHTDLRRVMTKSSDMNNALIALFGAELAGKVENAMPVNLERA